jgi:hypothetical protein
MDETWEDILKDLLEDWKYKAFKCKKNHFDWHCDVRTHNFSGDMHWLYRLLSGLNKYTLLYRCLWNTWISKWNKNQYFSQWYKNFYHHDVTMPIEMFF